MTTFEREADLNSPDFRPSAKRFGGDDGQVFEEVARGRHTIDALVTRPNEAGQQERAELGIGEPLTGDRRAIYEWVARKDGRPMGDLQQ